MRNTNKLLIIIGIICVLSLIGTFVARRQMTAESKQPPIHIVVTGSDARSDQEGIPTTMRNAAELAVAHFTDQSGMPGRRIIVEERKGFDTPENTRQAVREIVRENRAALVLGYWSANQLAAMAPEVAKAGIPFVSLSSEHLGDQAERNWLFRLAPTLERQAQFLGNYTRNVIGEKIVTILHDDTPYGRTLLEHFEKIYNLFGTRIHKKLLLPADAPDRETRLDGFAREIKESQDGSALFLALQPRDAALFLKKARDRKARNLTVAPDGLATHAFLKTLQSIRGELPSTADYTNQLLVTLPLLFDTANESAQRFKNQYASRYGAQSPDWVAAYTYATLTTLLNHLAASWSPDGEANADLDRRKIHMAATSFQNFVTSQTPGIVDGALFDQPGRESKPIQMGRYDGDNLISALTQLHPIKEAIQRSGTTNYLEELQQGRMLFVNDRFMYKTNVVYTGMEVTEIKELDFKENTFSMEFLIWFRYRGSFHPETIEFTNAAETIALEEPVETLIKDDISFKLFKVKGKFSSDFLDTKRPYGSHVIGTSFRHKTLNRNNVLFVVDILGIGLQSGKTFLELVNTPQILSPTTGWKMDRAWLAQERTLTSTLGKPAYVGYGTMEPEFSRIDMGVIISRGEFAARDFVPYEYFIYLGICGLIGLIFALGIDINTQGAFWKVASWGLRVLFWPLFLVAFGNIFLDYSFQNMPLHFTDHFMLAYRILWWLIPAMLATMALERFLWDPLERRAHQPIPNVVRNIAAFLVYLLAGFGVTAFVFDEKLTSLLATSGLITMIIGLAVQANIANIFSGIAVNVERPFSIGDWLKIGAHEDAKLIDITWRTMRLRTRDGLQLSLPNAKATEMLVVNYSAEAVEKVGLAVHVSPAHDPGHIRALLEEALLRHEHPEGAPPQSEFHGVINLLGRWVAKYEAEFWIADHALRKELIADIWESIWRVFRQQGISLIPDDDMPVNPALLTAGMPSGEGAEEEDGAGKEEKEVDKQEDESAKDKPADGGNA
ncbi:MAG: ABC transporter substrate-binding protein [Magnetococcales bacterium]|nr:ABC transporter substrate-binding protein [Magnetococcales bacterium]